MTAAHRQTRNMLSGQEGAQILEFAISLPLLVVFVVGIFDFGAAFTLKLKITNAAEVAARVAANQTTRDLSSTGVSCGPAPQTICAIRDTVDSILVAGKVNDCGLATASASSAGALAWQFTPSTGCPSALTLRIDRGVHYSFNLPDPFPNGSQYVVEATEVRLTYPYKWQFNNVIQLLVSGANYPSSSLSAVSTMQNLN